MTNQHPSTALFEASCSGLRSTRVLHNQHMHNELHDFVCAYRTVLRSMHLHARAINALAMSWLSGCW